MDTDAIAREIVSIRSRLNDLGGSDLVERRALMDRMHSLQEQMVDPGPDETDRDEFDITHSIPPI